MHTVGFTLEEWLRLLTGVFIFNIIGNQGSSIVSTPFGYRNTICGWAQWVARSRRRCFSLCRRPFRTTS